MKVDFQIRGLKTDKQLRNQLLSELQKLNELIPIAHAQVALERQCDSTPPFRALVLLGVPGPDIHAAARDHTWPAAWSKVTVRLQQQIKDRQNRQQARYKGKRNLHIGSRRSNGATHSRRV